MANFNVSDGPDIVGTAAGDYFDMTASTGPGIGMDTVSCGDGDDRVFVDLSIGFAKNGYSIDGGTGIDTLEVYATNPAHYVGVDLESGLNWLSFGTMFTISGVENVLGSPVSEVFLGTSAANMLRGGGSGDNLDGRGGADTFDYRDSTAGVTVDLAASTASGGFAEGDTIAGFERIWGSGHADELSGDDGRNGIRAGDGGDALAGAGGADILHGMAGADTLDGGSGGDRLSGGRGADVFVYGDTADSRVWKHRDTITDFVSGVDRIDLSAIDTDAAAAGDQGFRFLGDRGGFASLSTALRYAATDDGATLLADLDGDRKIDFAIDLAGVTSLTADDFIL